MAVATRQGREKPTKIKQENETKEGPRTGVRTLIKTNNTPGWPNLHRTGSGRDKHIKRGAKASSLSPSLSLSLSLLCAGALFSSCLWIDVSSWLEDGFSCYILNKIEL